MLLKNTKEKYNTRKSNKKNFNKKIFSYYLKTKKLCLYYNNSKLNNAELK
jgi:hypothetical protein